METAKAAGVGLDVLGDPLAALDPSNRTTIDLLQQRRRVDTDVARVLIVVERVEKHLGKRAQADVVIDFTSPAATVAFTKQAAQTGTVHVIGTTGLSDEDLAVVAKAAEATVIVRAGNMSLGVNLLVQLTKKVAAALDEDFDIEVIEAHHNCNVARMADFAQGIRRFRQTRLVARGQSHADAGDIMGV